MSLSPRCHGETSTSWPGWLATREKPLASFKRRYGGWTREMGIRMALGARHRSLVLSTLGRSLALALPGIAAGLLAAMGAGRLVSHFPYGVEAGDPITYGAGVTVLSVACLWAALAPALRIGRLASGEVLREE
jgi:ABC-type antimicrobial peptide transport system permease subunit